MKLKRGGFINLQNERILNDERIRRIILANLDEIRRFERSRGARNYKTLNRYVENKYSVFSEYSKKTENNNYIQYLSASQLILYLEHLGYELDFVLTKKGENIEL